MLSAFDIVLHTNYKACCRGVSQMIYHRFAIKTCLFRVYFLIFVQVGSDAAGYLNACVAKVFLSVLALQPSSRPSEAEPGSELAVFTAARSWQSVKRRTADPCTCLLFIMCCHWDWDCADFHELAQHPGQWSTKLKLLQHMRLTG